MDCKTPIRIFTDGVSEEHLRSVGAVVDSRLLMAIVAPHRLGRFAFGVLCYVIIMRCFFAAIGFLPRLRLMTCGVQGFGDL
eukprot:3104861-Amphidinium_carterae.1